MKNKKKKLLLISQSGRGGLRKHLCDILTNIDYSNFDVWIAYNDFEVDDKFRSTIKKLDGKVKPILIEEFVREINFKKDFQTYLKISRLIKKIKPDVVHCHSSKAGVIGRVAAKINHVPKIFYTAHGYAFLSSEFSNKKKKLFVFIERFLSKYATTKNINTSYGEKEAALKEKIDIDSKFDVIYNGLGVIKYPLKKDIRRSLRIPSDKFLFGTMARMDFPKNPELFFSIANKVVKIDSNIHFLWIGDGEYKSKIKKYILDNNLSSNVHLMDYQENTDILVKGFDAFLSTSNGESFGYSVVEAQRAGVPLLLTDVMGHQEMILENVNGRLFSNESMLNNISEIFNFIEWVKYMDRSKITESFAERFSIEKMINQITKEYE
ncbi:MAG TPA: glycosyltransferase [Lactovum miscens]|uniref:glycosyltransferase n=1 Tax=Lactovum miscens TaxID=190387 RepID=UPI002ED9AEBF